MHQTLPSGHPTARGGRSIPSLDGLRAISILFVLAAHLGGTRGFPLSEDVTNYFSLGNTGVRVFFVISGFLITTLLLGELDARGGHVDLSRFYVRRTLRIFPAYFAFLGAVIALRVSGLLAVSTRDLVHALTYTSNYNLTRGWPVGHTWSLAVEEQFYLLWPALLLLLGRVRGLRAALVFVLLGPVVRLGVWYLVPAYQPSVGISFESVGDSIACGCLLAGYGQRLWTSERYRRCVTGYGPALAVLVILVCSALDKDHPRLHAAMGATATNLAIALLIDYVVRVPSTTASWLLNTPAAKYVGVLSYSIYLWQQLFLNRESAAWITSFPVNVVGLSVAALASYYLVERPALRLRPRLERTRPLTVPPTRRRC